MDLTTVFSLLGPVSIVILLLALASLSRRLGAVTRRRTYYRLFYPSAALVALSVVLRLAYHAGTGLDGQAALLYDLPLAVGLLIAVVVAWHYWGWLLYEQEHTDL